MVAKGSISIVIIILVLLGLLDWIVDQRGAFRTTSLPIVPFLHYKQSTIKRKRDKMRFQIKTLTGKTIDMDLDPQETIGELKNRVQLREGKRT